MLSLLFTIWFIGAIFGLIVFCVIANVIGDRYDQYWYLFMPVWPLGILVFLLWAVIQTYILVIRIISNQ
jgi:multisubunit Na+/H+ antiporter MnhE subunit